MNDVEISVRDLTDEFGEDKRVNETARFEFSAFLENQAEKSSPGNANKHRRNLLAVARGAGRVELSMKFLLSMFPL